jgi:hypothetical protein
MNGKTTLLITVSIAVAFACCSSGPEGPVTKQFLDSLTYGVKPGSTSVDTFDATATVIPVPFGIGTGSLLRLGEIQGIVFEAILLSIDLSTEGEHGGKPVSGAVLSLPVRIEDTLSTLYATCHELLQVFEDEDTISAVPPFDPAAVPDATGETVRELGLETKEFGFDTSYARRWVSSGEERLNLAIVWDRARDPNGFVEMHSREYGSDPALLRIDFTDGTADTFLIAADYAVASFEGAGLDCVGGVATRIHFTFDIDDLDDRAMIHRSSLVLTVRGGGGLGVTPGEALLLFLPSTFYYYLYTPGSSNPANPAILSGTEVDRGSFDPTDTRVLKLNLRGFIPDVAQGKRINTGLILQSDLEAVRFQRASFYEQAAADTVVIPFIEVIYTLPADFIGGS